MGTFLKDFDPKKLIKARKALGLSQPDLSRRSRIGLDSIEAMEAGNCAPFVGATLTRLCNALGVNTEDLIKRQPEVDDDVLNEVRDLLRQILTELEGLVKASESHGEPLTGSHG